MAVYKLFPVKDATLYSGTPDINTGLDQITELSNTNTIGGALTNASVVRFLTAFDQNQINNVINNNVSNSQWQANLKCYLANGSGITSNTDIFVNPLAQDWNNGTGTYSDSPPTTNGVSWKWRTYLSGSAWTSSNYGPYITASFQSSNPGGGTWYTGSSNTSVTSSNIQVTQSLNTTSIKDLNINVTDIVKLWNSSSISNYGFIVRLDPNLEFNSSASAEPNLKYFSVDTHTIYPPQLEIKWNDFYWNTGSSTQTIINNNQLYISLEENPGVYYPDSINRFNLNVRPKYPPRVYQTASEYLTNYYLPTASCYAVKDLDTNEYVIDFDTTYTKLNADGQCNYFTLYMNGLEPERYYKILIKTILNGSTLVLDNDYYFKIING